MATLGSADTCTVTADDPRLASVAARVTVDIKGRVDITPQGDAELFLDDEPVTDVREWEPGMLLKAGDSSSAWPNRVSRTHTFLPRVRRPRLQPSASPVFPCPGRG
ncbi:hypothetical protein ACFQV4_37175 [Streptomyces thermocarboxydus]